MNGALSRWIGELMAAARRQCEARESTDANQFARSPGVVALAMTGSSVSHFPQPQDPSRSSSRSTVWLICEVRQGTRPWQQVRLDDLSACGFRISGLMQPSKAMPLSIRIPGMQLLTAQIRWEAGTNLGCEFVQPLHVAVYDHLVRQAKAL